MTTVLENLLKCNEINKKNKEAQKLQIKKKEKDYYLVNDNRTINYKIKEMGKLFNVMSYNLNKPYCITNISMLKRMGSVINNYVLTQKEWIAIYNIVSKIDINSFSIIKVKNMHEYVTKSILVGGFKIEIQHNCYILLSNKNKDYILLSDINLVVTDKTEFCMTNLYAKTIKISNIDIANELGLVTDLSFLFYLCINLEKIELKNFDTRNIKTFEGMFSACSKLKEVNLDILNTESAKNLTGMFYGCSCMTELNLNHFKVDKVMNLTDMFRDCISLYKLKIDKWNIGLKTKLDGIVLSCDNLDTTKVKVNKEKEYVTQEGNYIVLSRECTLEELIDNTSKKRYF